MVAPLELTETVADDDTPRPEPTPQEKELLELFRKCKREAQRYRATSGPGSMSLEDEWRDCGERYMGNYDNTHGSIGQQEGYRIFTAPNGPAGASTRGLIRAKLLRTQNAIIANTSAINQRSIRPALQPIDTGDTKLWMLTEEAGRRVKGVHDPRVQALEMGRQQHEMGVPMEQIAQSLMHVPDPIPGLTDAHLMGDFGPSEPLTFEVRQALLMDPEIAPLIGDKGLIDLSDKLITHSTQQVLDDLWERADADLHVLMGELYCNIYGTHAFGFQWLTDEHRFEIENKHILNVWTDHAHYDLQKRAYHIEDYILPVEKAKTLWPDHAEAIERAKRTGRLGGGEYTMGGIYGNVEHERDMLIVTIGWFRHQDVPMSVEEAIRKGRVLESLDETGQPTGYVLADTGEAVEPAFDTHAESNWPRTSGVRQGMVIECANVVIEDVRCPFWDIPHSWNLNIPRADMGAYGQGEPVRVRDVDDQINRTLSLLANVMAYCQFPQYFWPATLLSEVKRQGFSLHSRPGANIPIPDTEWERIVQAGGFSKFRHDPPPVPPEFINYLQFLLQEHDNSSGNTDVKQGRAPYAGAPAKAIEALGQQAYSSMSMRSRFTEFAVMRLGRLALHEVLHRLPESEWLAILGKLPLPVVRWVMEQAQKARWSLKVQIPTGSGHIQERDEERSLSMYDRKLKSAQSTMRAMGEDSPEDEWKKIVEEQTGLSPDASQMQAATGGAAPMAGGGDAQAAAGVQGVL